MKTHRTQPGRGRRSGNGRSSPQQLSAGDARRGRRPRHYDRFAQVPEEPDTSRNVDEEGEDEDEALERR